MPSADPVTLNTDDGWRLALGAKGEALRPVPPLTTAASSREYIASGTFIGSLTGPEAPRGLLEVGYEIGCSVDMSSGSGVMLNGNGGLYPQLGAFIPVGPGGGAPTLFPLLGAPINGGVTVGLKPGIVWVVPVDKKEFKGGNPWVLINNFHVKIDGCVGQSFIRSFATLTRSTDESDILVSYIGLTKAV